MTEQDTFLTEDELSVELGIPVPTLRTWRSRRVGPPFVKIGPRTVRYSRKGIADYCAGRTVETTA